MIVWAQSTKTSDMWICDTEKPVYIHVSSHLPTRLLGFETSRFRLCLFIQCWQLGFRCRKCSMGHKLPSYCYQNQIKLEWYWCMSTHTDIALLAFNIVGLISLMIALINLRYIDWLCSFKRLLEICAFSRRTDLNKPRILLSLCNRAARPLTLLIQLNQHYYRLDSVCINALATSWLPQSKRSSGLPPRRMRAMVTLREIKSSIACAAPWPEEEGTTSVASPSRMIRLVLLYWMPRWGSMCITRAFIQLLFSRSLVVSRQTT